MTMASRRWRMQRALHASRRKVAGLADEAAWRDFLRQITGGRTDSTALLTMAEVGRALDLMHARGAPTGPRLAEPQLRMARGLWISLHQAGAVRDGGDAALDAFTRRVTGVGRLAWCAPDQANKVIEALKDWSRRAGIAP